MAGDLSAAGPPRRAIRRQHGHPCITPLPPVSFPLPFCRERTAKPPVVGNTSASRRYTNRRADFTAGPAVLARHLEYVPIQANSPVLDPNTAPELWGATSVPARTTSAQPSEFPRRGRTCHSAPTASHGSPGPLGPFRHSRRTFRDIGYTAERTDYRRATTTVANAMAATARAVRPTLEAHTCWTRPRDRPSGQLRRQDGRSIWVGAVPALHVKMSPTTGSTPADNTRSAIPRHSGGTEFGEQHTWMSLTGIRTQKSSPGIC